MKRNLVIPCYKCQSGLTIGQRYWIDIFADSLSGTGFIINSGNVILWEIN